MVVNIAQGSQNINIFDILLLIINYVCLINNFRILIIIMI